MGTLRDIGKKLFGGSKVRDAAISVLLESASKRDIIKPVKLKAQVKSTRDSLVMLEMYLKFIPASDKADYLQAVHKAIDVLATVDEVLADVT